MGFVFLHINVTSILSVWNILCRNYKFMREWEKCGKFFHSFF